uniref:Retrotransposon gag domain-containing protein n=1 Tax=Solanum lycopersicum TaxID=4081 RepID=A0A3Q7EGD1_SOLLC
MTSCGGANVVNKRSQVADLDDMGAATESNHMDMPRKSSRRVIPPKKLGDYVWKSERSRDKGQNLLQQKDIADMRGLFQEMVGKLVPMGAPQRDPFMDAPAPTLHHKPASVELGRFGGQNPEAWLFQAERYLDFYGIAAAHRLTLASFYLDGEALDWYRWLFRNK